MIARIALVLSCGVLLGSPEARASTGFLKGEEQSGFNKICVYDVLGSAHTINVPSTSLCPQTINVNNPASPPPTQLEPLRPAAKVGHLTGERTSGMNKVCFYDYLGDTYTATINAVSLCPLTKQF